MIIKTTAIPLACYPYSSTSRIVHWLTRHHGKISTVLKGALRPKSPFLGEYELFSTSELLYFSKQTGGLHAGKECALLHPRSTFRTDWRAMQTASYSTFLFNRTTPDEAPQPGLFGFFEELLDWTEEYGRHPQFLIWSELKFCSHHGHAPNLGNCTLCSTSKHLRFSATTGGVVCSPCAKAEKLSTLESPPDILAILRVWQKVDQPQAAVKTGISTKQHQQLSAIVRAFMQHQFSQNPEQRNAIWTPRA